MSTASSPVYDRTESQLVDAEFEEVPSIDVKEAKQAEEISLADSFLQRQAKLDQDRGRAIQEQIRIMDGARDTLVKLGHDFGVTTLRRGRRPKIEASPSLPSEPSAPKKRGPKPKSEKQAADVSDKRAMPDSERMCPICSVKGHSARSHKFQKTKKAFTDKQLAAIAKGESPNPAKA